MNSEEELCVGNHTLIFQAMNIAIKERMKKANDVVVEKKENHEHATDKDLGDGPVEI